MPPVLLYTLMQSPNTFAKKQLMTMLFFHIIWLTRLYPIHVGCMHVLFFFALLSGFLADIRRWINVGLTLVHRLRRWINGKPTLIVSAGNAIVTLFFICFIFYLAPLFLLESARLGFFTQSSFILAVKIFHSLYWYIKPRPAYSQKRKRL